MICNSTDPEQIKLYRELVDGPIDKIVKNPKAIATGQIDPATFEFLWHKYTKSPWGSRDITKIDMKRFKSGVNEWLNGIGVKQNWLQRNFKLPKRVVGNFVGGEKFIEVLGEAASYHQRFMKEGAKSLDIILTDGLFKMFTDVDSPIFKKRGALSKKDYKQIVSLETRLAESTPGSEKSNAILRELIELGGYSGDPTKQNISHAGEVLRRFEGILDFSVTQGLTPLERTVLQQWNVLRADTMKGLLNGAISARRTVELLNNPVERKFLTQAVDKIQSQIDGLLIQSSIDMKKIKANPGGEGWEKTFENGLEVIDPYTGKTEKYKTLDAKTGEYVVGIKKYFPKYVIELTEILNKVTDYAQTKDKADYKGMTPEQVEQAVIDGLDPTKVTRRLERAGDSEKYYSLDPVFYLNKYVHDVASFNFKSKVNHAYSVAIKDLVKAVRENNVNKGNVDIGEYSSQMIQILAEIHKSAVNNNGERMRGMEDIVRIINGFEYISKLGFSVKSGFKNRTQGLWNWVKFGLKGKWLKRKFYQQTSRPYDPTSGEQPVGNHAMLERQLRRFGFLTGEKSLMGLDLSKGEGIGSSALTEGSLDAIMVPKGFTTDKQGLLIRTSDSGGVTKFVADKMGKIAELSAERTIFTTRIGSQQWAENQNRLHTFKETFAHAFTGELRRYDYWKNKLSSKDKTATDKQIYDAMENSAGNISQEMVKMLHFDYDNWAKARILQGKTGKVIGQFQHFKFAFFDLNYQLFKEVARDASAGIVFDKNPWTGKKQIAQSYQEMMRMSMIYSLIPGLFAAATDYDIGGLFSTAGWVFGDDKKKDRTTENRAGLIDNPLIEDAFKLINYLGADPGEDNYLERKYGTFYGKNPITANLGPFVSDLITIAELTDFLQTVPEDYEKDKQMMMDISSKDWQYQIARIFNIQGARTYFYTLPAFLEAGTINTKMARIELGTYKPRWISKWRKEKMMPALREGARNIGIPVKKKKRKNNKAVLKALEALGG